MQNLKMRFSLVAQPWKSSRKRLDIKWPRRTEGTFGIGLSAAIAADESGIFLESGDFCCFTGFGQFAEMHFVVVRVGAKVVNVRESVAHGSISSNYLPHPLRRLSGNAISESRTSLTCPNSSLFSENNARNINYMPVLIFPKRLDFEQNAYFRTSS
jgi:hypothetical protein